MNKPKPMTKQAAVKMLKSLSTVEQMYKLLATPFTKAIKDYKVGQYITPLNKMDKGKYTYQLTMPMGTFERPDFRPRFTPMEMLALGVFEGHYLNDCLFELPKEWYLVALHYGKLSPSTPDISCNFFKVKSRMSLGEWRRRGWIPITPGDPDNRGWFQWYTRYYIGRRIPTIDDKQIARWKAFKRHYNQVAKNCNTLQCRPKQRQALLQWGYDAFVSS